MSTRNERGDPPYAIEIEPELRAGIEAAAAKWGVSVRDYVAAALRAALAGHGDAAGAADGWSRLSHRSFARDWETEADAVYDDLA